MTDPGGGRLLCPGWASPHLGGSDIGAAGHRGPGDGLAGDRAVVLREVGRQ